MKILHYLIDKFIAPIIVGIIILVIRGFILKLPVKQWLQFFDNPTPVWILIIFGILIWLIFIIYHKRIEKLEKRIDKPVITANDIKPIYRENVYWFPNKDGTLDGPFCTNCYDDQKKRIRLYPLSASIKKCPRCKTAFRKQSNNEKKHKTSELRKFLNEP